MSEKGRAQGAAPRGCGRAEEFVTYLYGEATPAEARAFRQHLNDCAVCREELAALGGVREGLARWRAEALGSAPSLDISAAFASAPAPHKPAERKRSAAAAFREFFALSPLWLRAGAFAAALVFCALAALTLARAEVRWGAGGGERVIVKEVRVPMQTGYTEEQVAAIVAKRVEEVRAQFESHRETQVVETSAGPAESKTQSTGAQRRNRKPRAGARHDRELLAEDNLPRLSDLLDGSY